MLKYVLGIHYRPLGVDVQPDGTVRGHTWLHFQCNEMPSDNLEYKKWHRTRCCPNESFFMVPE